MMLSVIIPAYNEEDSIENLLYAVFASPPSKEVIIVNDASGDKTKQILERIEKMVKTPDEGRKFLRNLKVVHKEKNEGKGAAIRTGLDYVSGDVVLIQDADLELDPREYPKLMEQFHAYNADAVFGSRFRMEGIKRVFRFKSFFVNRVITIFSNIFSGLYLTDVETCYKVIRSDIFKSLKIRSNRFEVEPEIVAKLAKRPELAIFEVPIAYNARTRKQGKKIGFKDGVETLWAIFKFNVLS